MRSAKATALISVALVAAAPAPVEPQCADGYCTATLTAPQLLAATERLVMNGRYDEARPLLAALEMASEFKLERNFLEGYVAAETGDYSLASKRFRSVLATRPDMTRARLELARVLMLQGKDQAADYHYSLALDDGKLPPEIAETIYGARALIRDRERFKLNFTIGLAPDSNINAATADRTVNIFGLPFELDDDARAKTGIGQMATVTSGVRLRMADGLALVVDADGYLVNYDGTQADDMSVLFNAGPELTFNDRTQLVATGTAQQRWYGGRVVTQSTGARATLRHQLTRSARIQVAAEAKSVNAKFDPAYDGWSYAANATLEHVVAKSLVASVSAYARRDDTRVAAYSSTEGGLFAGLGGELPHGINAGFSLQASRAVYDDPLAAFGETRKDWRYGARVNVGSRTWRLLGFSPSATYSYARTDSSIDFYSYDRHRIEFQLARYF